MSHVFINEGVDSPLRTILKTLTSKQRLCIVGGEKSYPNDLFRGLLTDAGLQENRDFKTFFGFSVNPKSEELFEGLNRIREYDPTLIIGIGGGSILDLAKMARVFLYAKYDYHALLNFLAGKSKLPESVKFPPLLLMPTTAGTGAEATAFSVVYINNEKFSFAHEKLIPDYVIADRALIRSAPKEVLASSAFDAISQAIESLWAQAGTDRSRDFARNALSLMWSSARGAILDREDTALSQIVLGSHLAGQAINISKTTGNHALSYKLSTDYSIPHGHCVGMLLPQFFNLHLRISETDPDRASQVVGIQKNIISDLGFESFSKFLEAYHQLLADLGLENFGELTNRYQFDGQSAVDSVNLQRLSNHPIALDRSDLLSIFN